MVHGNKSIAYTEATVASLKGAKKWQEGKGKELRNIVGGGGKEERDMRKERDRECICVIVHPLELQCMCDLI